MEQRTSIMITAIIFAIVVAGSVAYLVYTNPSVEESTPTPSLDVSPTPSLIVVATPKPRPTLLLETSAPTPQVAAVSASAPTGTSDILVAVTALVAAGSAFSLFKLSSK